MRDAQEKDQEMMRRALGLAARARGKTAPNPMVGCVLVSGDDIVGEGFHARAGEPHAEVMALREAGEKARGAVAYVTLEPCNHTGRTGPCAQALIEAGIAEVVFAVADPHEDAAGGAQTLRAAGVAVREGVCETEARDLNRAWLHYVKTGRPYVIAKSAMSLDGRIATSFGESKWITGEAARAAGHDIRAGADAIIVGADTVLADDPALTARIGDEVSHPLRVVLDSTGRTSPGAKVFERSGRGALLATTTMASETRLAAFRDMGVQIFAAAPDGDGRADLGELLGELKRRGAVTVMVEGGGAVLGAFFDADLIDEIVLFVAPKLIGGGKPAFGGDGVASLSDASRFAFDAPVRLGDDFMFRGVRKEAA